MLRDSTHEAIRQEAIKYLKQFGGFEETDWSPTAVHEDYDEDTGVTLVMISLINGKGNRLWLDCGVIEYPDGKINIAYWNLAGGEILQYL